MRPILTVILVLGVVVALAATALFDPPPSPRERAVQAWLGCEECQDGQRARVVSYGDAVIPLLRQALLGGPSPAQRAVMRDKYVTLYNSIQSAGLPAGTPAVTRDEYVRRALSNHVATYQMRAAAALGSIGGPRATAVLQTALNPAGVSNYRADVIATVRVARALADTARFRGAIGPMTPGFGDTVVVRPPAFEPFNGDEIFEVDGSPIPAADVLVFRQTDRAGFLITAPPGQRVVTIRNVGTTTHSQSATITVRSLMDANDRRTTPCTSRTCLISAVPRYDALQGAVKHFFTLWNGATGVDTADYIRIQPAAPLRVTARLSWQGNADLNLNWVDCNTGAPRGNTDGATTANPEVTTVDVPAGQCWMLLTRLMSTSPTVFAVLQLSP